MRQNVISGLTSSAIFFPHFHIHGTILGKKMVTDLTNLYRYSAQILSETFIIRRRTDRDLNKIVTGIYVKF
jgi:hypothetical protein